MGVFVGVARVTCQTLSGSGANGLELCRGQAQLMNVMAGGTRDPLLGMNRLSPVIILSMMGIDGALAAGLHIFFIRFVVLHFVRAQRPARQETHRPVDIFNGR